MKSAALIAVTLIAGTVACFAIYTFGWREEKDFASDRARAAVAASSAARIACESPCDATGLRHRGGPVWEFHAQGRCYIVDIDRFEIFADGTPNEGAARCTTD